MLIRTLAGLICLSVSVCIAGGVRVCPSFREYDENSTKCYNDPISGQNITEVIQSWGFKAEEHYITTDDGYILLLERAYSNITRQTPIIIVHGIAMNAFGFLYKAENSLVYHLGNLGYDVWVLSFRGITYSRGHTYLTTNDTKYWYYSLHEIGIYDLRSTIKYVNEQTQKKSIYIGYSTGTTTFYTYSTTLPGEADLYLKGMIGLGPAINFKGAKTILQLSAYVWPIVKPLIYKFFHGEIIPGYTTLLEPLMSNSMGMYLAQTVVNLVGGFDYEQMDAISFPLLPKWLDTAAVNVWTHFIQIYRSDVFQRYDYGITENLKVYRQETPPPYNITEISVPIALFVGPNDWLAPVSNAEQLYSELTESSKCGYHYMGLSQWSHYDFVMAKDIKEYLYEPLFDKILEIENGKCQP